MTSVYLLCCVLAQQASAELEQIQDRVLNAEMTVEELETKLKEEQEKTAALTKKAHSANNDLSESQLKVVGLTSTNKDLSKKVSKLVSEKDENSSVTARSKSAAQKVSAELEEMQSRVLNAEMNAEDLEEKLKAEKEANATLAKNLEAAIEEREQVTIVSMLRC